MKKFFLTVFLLIIALAAFVVVAKDQILKAAIEVGVSSLTGFKTKVDSLQYDFPSTIHIQGLEIDNPSGFQEKVFVKIPEIYVSLVLPELLKAQRIHLPEMRLNIQEVHLEKNEKGVSNVELLSTVGGKAKSQPSTQAQAQPPALKAQMLPFLLEHFELTIRNVTFQDRSGILGAAPVPNRLALDLNVNKEVFTDIGSPQALVNLILVKVLNGVTFGKLLNLNPDKLLGGELSTAIGTGREFVGKQANILTQGAGTVAGQASKAVDSSETVKKAESAVTGSAAAAKEKISGLFGKIKDLKPGESSTEKTQ